MIAIPLIFRRLTADDCADEVAADSRINALRAKLNVIENKKLTEDYFDPNKRYIGNSIEVFFKEAPVQENSLSTTQLDTVVAGKKVFQRCWQNRSPP